MKIRLLVTLESIPTPPTEPSSTKTECGDALKPNPNSLRWLADQLTALASDETIPLPKAIRDKCLGRISQTILFVEEDPISAAWTLRQVYANLVHEFTKIGSSNDHL